MKTISSKIFCLTCFLLLGLSLQAQIAINRNGAAPNPSAMLEVTSTNKGFLTPRMTATERAAIASPATGLLIYQTDDPAGFYYNQGSSTAPDWVRLGNTSDVGQELIRIPIDSVAHFANYNGNYTNYVITQSGSYYLTDTFSLRQTGGFGIIIDVDDVTLDLNGFAIYGDGPFNVNNGSTPSNQLSDPGGSGSGILVDGEHFNITIKNGNINSWQDEGIQAPDVKNAIFQNLNLRYNGQHGMRVGDQNLIDNCVGYFNVLDGIHAGVGNNFINCRGQQNGESSMQADSSSQFVSCTAFDNYGDGITAGIGSLILGCVSTDNDLIGINTASDCSILKCSAFDNFGDGIQAGDNCTVRNCIAANNEGSGIQLTGQTGVIINNTVHENDINGIICSNTALSGIRVDGNTITDNDVVGLVMQGGGGLVVRNMAAGNAANFSLQTNTNRGPVVDVRAVGDISTVTNADHPLANFEY
ncbi:MAG: right-handed parallel beta-helix repeat-containing protein [Bacteroidota bacterium]